MKALVHYRREIAAHSNVVLRHNAGGPHRKPFHEGPGRRGPRGGPNVTRLVDYVRTADRGVCACGDGRAYNTPTDSSRYFINLHKECQHIGSSY